MSKKPKCLKRSKERNVRTFLKLNKISQTPPYNLPPMFQVQEAEMSKKKVKKETLERF